jgi:hypothetical protein
MEAGSIIGIIIFLVAVVIILKFVKSVLKTLFIVSTLIGVVIFIFMIFFYQDVSDFKTNFPIADKLILLREDDTLLAGFKGAFTEGEQPDYIKDMSQYQDYYDKGDLDSILEDNFKLFIIDINVFERIDSAYLGEEEIKRDFAVSLIRSDTPFEDYAAYYIEKKGLPGAAAESIEQQLSKEIGSETEFKGAIFASLFSAATQQDALFLFTEYKNDNVLVYEETILFKTLKKIPLILIKKFMPAQNGNTR